MIRPIEMQMLLPRTESYGQSQHNENQKSVSMNLNAANEVAKEVKLSSESIRKKEELEFEYNPYDIEEEKKEKKKRRKKSSESNLKDSEDEKHLDDEKFEDSYNNQQPRVNIQI